MGISTHETSLKLKKPLTCGVIKVDNTHLKKKNSPSQLPQQTLRSCHATKPDCVDKPTRKEVEARAEICSTSFEVDVSKTPQPPNNVFAP